MSAPVTREAMRDIGREIATQDNRITDAPIFIVQQKRTYVGADGYNSNSRVEWRKEEFEHGLASRTYARELETHYRRTGEQKNGWTRFSVFDVWEFVTACFTEQGCKDYLKNNGHNLNESRIYAAGSYRNNEFRAVRDYLLSLSDKPATPPESKP